MIITFTPGTKVLYKVPDSVVSEIVRYLGEDFYEVKHIPDGTLWIAHQDDLILKDTINEIIQ